MNPYEDIPIIESNNYRDLKFDEVLQSLSKVFVFSIFFSLCFHGINFTIFLFKLQINLSIISPKYSSEMIHLYEKINHANGEFKLDRLENNIFLVLLHNSIKLTGNKVFEEVFLNIPTQILKMV